MGFECHAQFMAASILEDPTPINHHCCDTILGQEAKKHCRWKNPKKPIPLMSTIIKDYCQTHNTTTKTGKLWKLGGLRRLSSSLCTKKVVCCRPTAAGMVFLTLSAALRSMDHCVVGGICLGILSNFEKGRHVVSACKKKVVPYGKPVLP